MRSQSSPAKSGTQGYGGSIILLAESAMGWSSCHIAQSDLGRRFIVHQLTSRMHESSSAQFLMAAALQAHVQMRMPRSAL